MLRAEQIIRAVEANGDRCDEERGLFVELPNGEVRELCNITFIDGRCVLRTSTQIN